MSGISKRPTPVGMNYVSLVKAINAATTELQGRAAAAVNQALVLRNWLVGAYLVEFEQKGKDRAKYGARLLEKLAEDMASCGLKGLDERTLRDCRFLFQRYAQIRGAVTPELLLPLDARGVAVREMGERTSVKKKGEGREVVATPRLISRTGGATLSEFSIRGSVTPELPTPLSAGVLLGLSWTKLQELIRLDDAWKRAFYENECLKGNWSVRQLQRQIGSMLYERTGLSTNRRAVIDRARKQGAQETIEELIRDPYVLEFTGLAQRPEYLESDLECALLNHLQGFLLELGEGFCFESRQKRITVGRKHDYIDLVFYHRRLRCHVLIDLKTRPFRHGDAGQMNFYLNWWKAHGMEPGDQPPVGIILCSDRERVEVEFATAGLSNALFVSRYLVALPSAEKLRSFLESDRDRIESLMRRTSAAKKRRGEKRRQ